MESRQSDTGGERDKNGDETWRVGLSRTTPAPEGTTPPAGGSVANVFGAGKATVTATETSFYSGTRTIAFGKPTGASWQSGAGVFTNPLPEDRPVCLHHSEGGTGEDRQTPLYTIRVMCQVLTPELAQQLKAERDAKRAAEVKERE